MTDEGRSETPGGDGASDGSGDDSAGPASAGDPVGDDAVDDPAGDSATGEDPAGDAPADGDVAGDSATGEDAAGDGPPAANGEGSTVRLDEGPAGRPDGPGGPDPAVVRSVAVAAEDLVAAVEADVRGRLGGRAVLRVTPPFAPRMRARLHVLGAGDSGPGGHGGGAGRGDGDGTVGGHDDAGGGDDPDGTAPAPVHLDPTDFVADVPPFPHPDDTEDELRAADVEYTPDRHRRRHEAAVAEWREAVRSRARDRVPFPVGGGGTRPEGDRGEAKTVDVSVLGGPID